MQVAERLKVRGSEFINLGVQPRREPVQTNGPCAAAYRYEQSNVAPKKP
jgi:hypothetical protein